MTFITVAAQPAIERPSTGLNAYPEALWVMLASYVAIWIYQQWLVWYAKRSVSGGATREAPVDRDHGKRDWVTLQQRAERVIEETMASLPEPVRAEALRTPCLYREWAEDLHGSAALGIFSGFEPDRVSQGGSIIIFLGDIDRYCAENERSFEDEVRVTYLHELGHHLGWGEGELEARGLG